MTAFDAFVAVVTAKHKTFLKESAERQAEQDGYGVEQLIVAGLTDNQIVTKQLKQFDLSGDLVSVLEQETELLASVIRRTVARHNLVGDDIYFDVTGEKIDATTCAWGAMFEYDPKDMWSRVEVPASDDLPWPSLEKNFRQLGATASVRWELVDHPDGYVADIVKFSIHVVWKYDSRTVSRQCAGESYERALRRLLPAWRKDAKLTVSRNRRTR